MGAANAALHLLGDLEWAGRTPDGTPACPACGAPARQARHAAGCRLAAVLATGAPADGEPRRWRHRKRGTTYREVGPATLQHSGGVLADGDPMVVYRAEADGTLGVRALIEFSDGRFVRC